MSRLKFVMLFAALIISTVAAASYGFLKTLVFGADPANDRLARVNKSPNYRDGSFQNIEPTDVMRQDASYIGMIGDYFNKSPLNTPKTPLPSVKTDLNALADDVPTLVWFGHSSYLIKYAGKTVLVDPVFSGQASPVSFFGASFPGTDVYGADDMPAIDLLILSHDHYDHLDYETIAKLAPRVKQFYTALGVGAHLQRWGITPGKVSEFDWGDTQTLPDGIRLTATPARHFSGRGLTRGKTLWTSFVLELPGNAPDTSYKLFLGGDSGYGTHFAQIGAKYGPFDLAMLECGQYNADWPNIHLFPEEVVTVAQELRAKAVLPVHWGKFALAYHAWNEPIQRFTKRAGEAGLAVATPKIGEPVVIGQPYPVSVWW